MCAQRWRPESTAGHAPCCGRDGVAAPGRSASAPCPPPNMPPTCRMLPPAHVHLQGAKSRPSGVFTIGAVGRCLTKSLVAGKSMAPKCRGLVLVAATKGARDNFPADGGASNSIMQAVVAMQNKVNIGSSSNLALVDQTSSTVTVTGWVALACIISLIVVVIGGAVLLYRRFIGADKAHTVHVKSGDA